MKSFLGLFVIVVVFATGEALKCYSCSSDLNAKCGELFDSGVKWNTTECAESLHCAKLVASTQNKTYVQRGCARNSTMQALPSTVPNEKDIVRASGFICNTDLCNGTNSITAGLSTLIILSIASIFMSRN